VVVHLQVEVSGLLCGGSRAVHGVQP
jgi:hypothetical protein